MLNLLLAEDHNIVRNGLKMILEADRHIDICGEAVNGREAVEFIRKGNEVDMVLADINMPELDGISMIVEIKAINPQIKVVILSTHDHENYISKAFSVGASGYLFKSVGADELLFSLKHVQGGGQYLSSELAMNLMHKVVRSASGNAFGEKSELDFSERELEILRLIGEGLTNSEMSEILFISKRTIEGHRQNLLDKTSCKNTAALVRFSIQNGLID